MRDASRAYLAYVEHEHARLEHETDPWKTATGFGIRVIGGRRNLASAGPPAVITLARDLHGPRQRFTLHHEIAHVLMQRGGFERDVVAEVDDEDADAHLEQVVNAAAGLMLMPEPMLREVLARHGDTPAVILALASASRATMSAALRRWVYSDPDAQRAAFLTSGSYIADAASCNLWLPFWRLDRVPEAASQPGVRAEALGPAKVLGVMTW